jgi:multidrug efflux pump subunit AcrA (membrane-fusion protein)
VVLTAVVAVFGLWAHFSTLDVTATARGQLVPEGSTRAAQAAGGGIVQFVFVREGDAVERGQPLVQLDAAELSLLHIHANRLLPSAQRQQELVIYDLLTRHDDSLLARNRQQTSRLPVAKAA